MAPSDSGSAGGPQTYEARGSVRAGGEGQLEALGLSAAFDATSGRVELLPGPADLLCAALSACILKNVGRFSSLLPFRYVSASVRVVAERVDAPPHITRLRYELTVVTDEPPHRLELLHSNLRKFGTITNTLAASCELSGSIAAELPPPGRTVL